MPDIGNVLLEIRGLSRSFPGVKALDAVDFTLRRGEIHALMGENGAGKSTLIKVLTGVHKKNSGSIKLEGKGFEASSPMDAASKGISTVYQEINLLPNLSVAENIFIGRQPMKGFNIDWKAINMNAKKALVKLNLEIDVTLPLSSFSTAIQQMVAIARVIDIRAKILILDEPTSSLDMAECENLFKTMNRLKEEGMGIIFITHFLDQVYETSDRITVLRNGQFIGEYKTAELPRFRLISKMLGKELEQEMVSPGNTQGDTPARKEPFMTLNNVEKKGVLFPFDLEICEGEVVGLAGLLGSGRTEVAKLLFGINRPTGGTMEIDKRPVAVNSPRNAISHSIAFCPEDRKTEGIIPDLTVRENIVLPLQSCRGFFRGISRKEQEKITDHYIELLKIKVSNREQKAGTLSGGNQQKVILARWMAMNPRLLILDEPTRGIDVGAKAEIEKLIFRLREEGRSILFISSELEEIVHTCSRVAILKDRKKVGEISGENISEEKIMTTLAQEGTGERL
ncbi:MAG: sugar ABC transporter ATP-binding protein [Deltaproteobacteria bacterium]|nr:sugar ABC transporter ATP-binding protein [Deltaproteobacteria bacterium]